jgi:hypothetical protein
LGSFPDDDFWLATKLQMGDLGAFRQVDKTSLRGNASDTRKTAEEVSGEITKAFPALNRTKRVDRATRQSKDST